MNYNCKYCDYVDKCSRKCEYNSLLCRMNRSFPKVVERPYKEVLYENSDLKLENKELKEKLVQKNKVIERARKRLGDFADEMTSNGSAYAICVDVLDILNKGVDE